MTAPPVAGTTAQKDHAGVHLPPPLVYVAAIGLGAWLSSRSPWQIGGGVPRLVAAYVLLGFSVALVVSCFSTFWSRGTTVLPIKPSTALVIAGPYRVSRNPMYVAMTILTIGAALWLDSWWILLFLVPVVVVIDLFVIRKEEAYLRRRFGPEYEAYMRDVRRWV